MRVILDQDKLNMIQSILNQFPIKCLPEVEQIVKLLNESAQVQNDPAPPIGGGGGSAKPPKP
jgi:hypothetical protein